MAAFHCSVMCSSGVLAVKVLFLRIYSFTNSVMILWLRYASVSQIVFISSILSSGQQCVQMESPEPRLCRKMDVKVS